MHFMRYGACCFAVVVLVFLLLFHQPVEAQSNLVNVSYDSTREFFRTYNAVFCQYWKQQQGQDVRVRTTHGGSGAQARTVADGLQADVATLALAADIDFIVRDTKKIPSHWRTRLPNDSAPYTSTIVFLVRKGNPKNIRDWGDLIKNDVEVVSANPKTSGGARWNFLAALAWAREAYAGDEQKVRDYMIKLYRRIPVLDSSAHGALMTFVRRDMGDALLIWENEALKEQETNAFDVVVPSVSIETKPSVALIDANVEAKGTRNVATAYLRYLYSQQGQELAAQYGYRPSLPHLVRHEMLQKFIAFRRVGIETFGGWEKVQADFFDDGGFFDQIYQVDFY